MRVAAALPDWGATVEIERKMRNRAERTTLVKSDQESTHQSRGYFHMPKANDACCLPFLARMLCIQRPRNCDNDSAKTET